MSHILSRQNLFSCYLKRAEDLNLIDNVNELSSYLKELPTFLCREILLAKPLNKLLRNANPLLGSKDSKFSQITIEDRGLYLAENGFSLELAREFDFEHFKVVNITKKRIAVLKEALLLGLNHFTKEADTIFRNLSLVIWLNRDENASKEIPYISCCSYRAFPHCAFITDLATCHIPPEIVFPSCHPYPMLENLYHESLHQELFSTINFSNVFLSNQKAFIEKSVWIPWRNTHWTLGHAMQGLYVYCHLLVLRKKYSHYSDFNNCQMARRMTHFAST